MGRWLTGEDLWMTPNPKWLIDGILPEGEFSMLYGPQGQYKSFVALDLSLSISTSTNWHGYTVTGGKVAYIAAEGGAGLRKRVLAWAREHGYQQGSDLGLHLFDGSVQLLIRDEVDELIDHLKSTAPDVKLVVFDTWAKSTIGLPSELDNAQVSVAVANAERVRDALVTEDSEGMHAPSILVVHHANGQGARPRGGTALEAASNTILRVDTVKMPHLHARLKVEKHKDAASGAHFDVTLQPVELPGDKDGTLMVAGVEQTEGEPVRREEFPTPVRAEKTRPRKPRISRDNVLAMVSEWGPIGPADIARALGVDPRSSSIKNHLKKLLEDRLVSKDSQGRYCDHERDQWAA